MIFFLWLLRVMVGWTRAATFLWMPLVSLAFPTKIKHDASMQVPQGWCVTPADVAETWQGIWKQSKRGKNAEAANMKNHFFFHFTSHSILSVSCKCVCLCDAHCAYKEALALEQPPTPPTIHSYRLKHNAPPSSPSPVFISPHSTLPTSSEPADLLPV